MGKIRSTIIGSEEEQKQKEDAKKRREAKKSVKREASPLRQGFEEQARVKGKEKGTEDEDKNSAGVTREEGIPTARTKQREGAPAGGKREAGPQTNTEPTKKKVVKKKSATRIRSPRWTENVKSRDKNKQYQITEALDVLISMKKSKFDESVELHINTTEKGVSGIFNPPHGTGKKTKVAIVAPLKDPKAADELIKQIETGKINFDILLATPDAMPLLAKVAKILGPRGLMPNPKNGTISPNPEAMAKKYEGGQLNYKTEPKFPIIHLSIGKVSFGKDKLAENINVFLKSIEKAKIKNAYIKSTMSPSLRLNI